MRGDLRPCPHSLGGPSCDFCHPTWDKLVRRACNGLSMAAVCLSTKQPARAQRVLAFRRRLESLTTWVPRSWPEWCPTEGPR